jgi:phosphatidate cytidylyltransferase
MLRWRLAVSVVLIPALVGIFCLDAWFGPTAPFLLGLVLVLALRSVWELHDLFRDRLSAQEGGASSVSPLKFRLAAFCTVGLILAAWVPHFRGATAIDLTPVALCMALSVMLLAGRAAVRFDTPGGNVERLGIELLIVSYVGLLLAMTVQLRWVAGADAGYLALGSLLVCAKGGDIGAFTVGKLCGRHKLAPRLSPGKTREGAVGAVLGAALCGWLWLQFATPLFNPSWTPCAWWHAVLYGAVLGIVGLMGDLCESLIKRDVGRKDSAAIFPGFGGLLDLLDSVLYAGPAALLMWLYLPLATW